MSYRVEALARDHDIDDFDCGVDAQTDYLRKYAWQNQLIGYGQTFLAVDNASDVVCGYYTLAMGRVEFQTLPDNFRSNPGLPKYPAPTALIAQLGVDTRFQGEGLGEALLFDAIQRAVSVAEEIAAVAIEVDAGWKRARSFYERYGFVQMQDSPDHLFLSMRIASTLVGDDD